MEKVLFLGPGDSPLYSWLQGQGEDVISHQEKIDPEIIGEQGFTFLVSYGYRHIIKSAVLELFPDRAINLHISLLPWNRGADPNFWSFLTGTPKGVTIHYLDKGLDTGDIIIQEEVSFAAGETLATSYQRLQETIQRLFREHWVEIKTRTCPKLKQMGEGSSHKAKDKEPFLHLLTDGWDTPVSTLIEYGAEMQISQNFWRKYDAEIEEIRAEKKDS